MTNSRIGSAVGTLVIGLMVGAAAPAHAGSALVVGAVAGSPNGQIFLVTPASQTSRSVAFAKAGTPAGNSFYIGYNPASHAIFIPSPIGRMTVLDATTGHRIAEFPVIRGARVARVLPHRNLLLVLSAKHLAAYALSGHALAFTLALGGNALAVNATETRLYVGGNADQTISIVSLPSGRVIGSYPVARSGDLLLADGRLFSADMQSGVMSVIDPTTGHVTALKTPEVDPHFSYRSLGKADAGFMQFAKSPNGQVVYSAGFSGHILEFAAQPPEYLGQVAVMPAKGANKLSGLAIVDHGKEALVTVENHHETALVKLKSGKILHVFRGVSSNRWVVIPGNE